MAALGRFPLALEKHAQAVSLSDKSRSVVLRSQALGNLAECLCRMGRTQEAVNTAERAVKSGIAKPTVPQSVMHSMPFWPKPGLLPATTGVPARLSKSWIAMPNTTRRFISMGHVLYVAANLNFMLGKFDAALGNIEKLCAMENREAPFYERELAEALRARILFERGNTSKAMASLYALEREVTAKTLALSDVCHKAIYMRHAGKTAETGAGGALCQELTPIGKSHAGRFPDSLRPFFAGTDLFPPEASDGLMDGAARKGTGSSIHPLQTEPSRSFTKPAG